MSQNYDFHSPSAAIMHNITRPCTATFSRKPCVKSWSSFKENNNLLHISCTGYGKVRRLYTCAYLHFLHFILLTTTSTWGFHDIQSSRAID